MAPTTINRHVGRGGVNGSSLKDKTIEKLALVHGLDYLTLIAHRHAIAEALRLGLEPPDYPAQGNGRDSGGVVANKGSVPGLKEGGVAMAIPKRDPRMDSIMGAAYDVWFREGWQGKVAFDRLPDIVRLLYARLSQEKGMPDSEQIRKRITDMLAALALEK